MSASRSLTDTQGRVMRDLRVSVTDRCNFRCVYCLPETEAAADFYRNRSTQAAGPSASQPIQHRWKPRSAILTFEEIERVVRAALEMGIQKVRLTGGEPLLRRHLEVLVERLAGLPGLLDLALTTNGFQFVEKADALKQAGLSRVTFSLDSLDRENFKKLTGRDGLDQVLAGIARARELGMHPVKVNAVVIRDLNDHELVDLAQYAEREDISMRFIEFMPLDESRSWQRASVVSGREMMDVLEQHFDLIPQTGRNPSETAKVWRFASGRGEIGIIAPVTEPFCGACNRLRLTADGKLRTCLFSLAEHDLKSILRSEEEQADTLLHNRLAEIVRHKEPGHRVGQPDFVQPGRSMSFIGG